MLVAPGPRVDMQMPGLPVMSPQVAASMAPATSCFIKRKRIWRWRAASISSTDSPPGWPTMNGVPASLNALASTSTVVAMAPSQFLARDFLRARISTSSVRGAGIGVRAPIADDGDALDLDHDRRHGEARHRDQRAARIVAIRKQLAAHFGQAVTVTR